MHWMCTRARDNLRFLLREPSAWSWQFAAWTQTLKAEGGSGGSDEKLLQTCQGRVVRGRTLPAANGAEKTIPREQDISGTAWVGMHPSPLAISHTAACEPASP